MLWYYWCVSIWFYNAISAEKTTSNLRLKHIFHKGSSDFNHVFKRADISLDATLSEVPSYQVSHIPYTAPSHSHSMKSSSLYFQNEQEWEAQHISSGMRMPDPKDPKTVLALAQMTLNAYSEPEKKTWVDIDGWNVSTQFGWERDGIRGYVFIDDKSEVMVITVKGTSPTWIGGGPTTGRDKFNDNMMFSCCCAYVDVSWRPICDCAASTTACSDSCIVKRSNFADSYYNMAQTIFLAIRAMYPRISVWLTGHSLGGALASLLALTNSIPAFAYEAPGDLLFAERLGLLPKVASSFPHAKDESLRRNYDDFLSTLPIYHFGNTGDPIYLGACNGVSSSCYWGGYALESKCHVGKKCVYELESKLEIAAKVDIRYHSIEYVIKTFLQAWDHVPECQVEKGCEDCSTWTFNE